MKAFRDLAKAVLVLAILIAPTAFVIYVAVHFIRRYW